MKAIQILAKQSLQRLFNEYGYPNCSVNRVYEHTEFIVLICDEEDPLGGIEQFDVIYRNGKFYNSSFQDLEQSYKDEQ